jgi:hypothetical protein
MSQIDDSKSYCRNADLLSVEMDGDLVMMSIESGNYFGVSGIGPRVWDLLESPRRFGDLVSSVVDEYEVDAETAASDLSTFLGKLEENGMIEVS